MSHSKENKTLKIIEKEYEKDHRPWYLGFSGGKDSSAMLKLLYIALMNTNIHKIVNVVYCDTGVEIPVIVNYVKETFSALKREVIKDKLPIKFIIVEPSVPDRFFSKVIGRGYPSPTNKFRWCTDRLRVKPIQNIVPNDKESLILVGVRKGESHERDRVIYRHLTKNSFFLKHSNFAKSTIFAPILDYDVGDIWSVLEKNSPPYSLSYEKLLSLYKAAGEDQIDFLDHSSKALEKGRFGCWVCTVVRRDKAMTNLVKNGYSSLKHLLEFRNWLYQIRDNQKFRCRWRRNGAKGPGPFTLEARKMILHELMIAQEKSKIKLISDSEIKYIMSQWLVDKNSNNYKE
ncbi:phosphoadenosine phosphosulfate reductase family protein [Lentisphaerota bacterium ZTH]|nr:phosphoadenosine phosphosulfate reductase family protein [Lentisphaerota bacterium]WET06080.1 phosphoadenosine phosphosulfate reductase family protein [Lentisphaerota bacterium ZTH]